MPVIPNTLAELSRLADVNKGGFPLPLSHVPFTFDSLSVAGFFGGDSSVAAMATVNTIPGRRWLGWYNSPGNLDIAKQYARLANLKICDALFPDGERDSARLFRLDGREGPTFIPANSGTVLKNTGHFGHLVTSKAEAVKSRRTFARSNRGSTTDIGVTIVNLQSASNSERNPSAIPPNPMAAYLAFVPIAVSVGTCMLCALVEDWFCFASIALGMVVHGIACSVIGLGRLDIKSPNEAAEPPTEAAKSGPDGDAAKSPLSATQATNTSPHKAEKASPGHGVLKGDRALVILVGDKPAVNTFTRGRFRLQYNVEVPQISDGPLESQHDQYHNPKISTPRYRMWFSALLLILQPLVQLFLVPLGTLFGQLMFITSIIVSWMYNIYLTYYLDHDEIQIQILFNMQGLQHARDMQKYRLGTWTATIAFTSFVLASLCPQALDDALVLLDELSPSNTVVGKAWKEMMAKKLSDRTYFKSESDKAALPETFCDWEKDLVRVDWCHRSAWGTVLGDTDSAWKAWCEVRNSLMVSFQATKQVQR